MKKVLFFGMIVLLFASCKLPDYSKEIIGTFSQTTISENELSNDAENTDVFAVCNTKKVSILNFNEDGTYSFSVDQSIDDVKFYSETQYDMDFLIEYFVHKIEIKGTYVLEGNKLTMLNDKVVLADDSEMDFDEYKQIDPAVGQKTQIVKFKVDEEKISLFYGNESISYKRR